MPPCVKFSILSVFIDLLVSPNVKLNEFWSIVDLSYKHQLDESRIWPIPGDTCDNWYHQVCALLTPLDDDMFWHCTFCVAVNTVWNNSQVFSAVQNVCEIANQNWTMLNTLNMPSSFRKMHKLGGDHLPTSTVTVWWSAAINLFWVPIISFNLLWRSVVPRGGNLTYNGDPRVGKLTFENLKMSNFLWVARPPHPGANHW